MLSQVVWWGHQPRKQTSHDEGRINAQGQYEYNINDHLGNLRVSFRDSSGIAVPVQSIFYDPWGLSIKGMQITRIPLNLNKHQFLNRETQFETGYIDLQNRQYDPIRGQFTSIDALAELSRRFSPFVYGNNNGLRFIDPDGMTATETVGADGLTNSQWLANRGNADKEQESRDDNKDKDKKKKKEEQSSLGGKKSNSATATSGAVLGTTLTNGGTTALTLEEIIAFGGMALRFSPLGLMFLVEGDTPHKEKDDEYFTFYHYTNEAGLAGILATNKILPNVKGKVYMTQSLMVAADVVQNLFLGSPKHADRGDYMVSFKLTQYQISQLQNNPSTPFEIVYPNGTLKLDKIIYAGPNPTK